LKTLSAKPLHLEVSLRWIARLLAAFFVGLVALFFVGEGGINPFKLSVTETVLIIGFFTTCIGMIVAWRRELIGGAMATTGILLFCGTESVVAGRFPKGLIIPLMVLPGLLFLVSGVLRKHRNAG